MLLLDIWFRILTCFTIIGYAEYIKMTKYILILLIFFMASGVIELIYSMKAIDVSPLSCILIKQSFIISRANYCFR